MYHVMSQLSYSISQPFYILADQYGNFPLLAAFLLGLVGALAPCQLTAGISAVTFYGQRSLREKTKWGQVGLFLLGKLLVYSAIGWLVWIFGKNVQLQAPTFFSIIRKANGPMVIIIGLVLLGIFNIEWITKRLPTIPGNIQQGYIGSFLMGAGFAAAFCPTMFSLFFVGLMPLVLDSSIGYALPAVFGFGTAIPLLIILLIMWFLGLEGSILKRSRKVGHYIQISAGALLIIVGVFDTITYL